MYSVKVFIRVVSADFHLVVLICPLVVRNTNCTFNSYAKYGGQLTMVCFSNAQNTSAQAISYDDRYTKGDFATLSNARHVSLVPLLVCGWSNSRKRFSPSSSCVKKLVFMANIYFPINVKELSIYCLVYQWPKDQGIFQLQTPAFWTWTCEICQAGFLSQLSDSANAHTKICNSLSQPDYTTNIL